MEFFQSLKKPSIWMTLAIEDLRDRYKRTLIGMIWIPLTFLLFVGVKILIFSKLNGSSLQEFTIYVVVGYWVWQNINSNVIDSCSVFIRSAGYIKSSPLPYSIYILQSIFRNKIIFMYNFIIVLFLLFITSKSITFQLLFVIPAFMVYILNAVWVGLLFGIISARFRDVIHLVQSLMRITFFLTPIIWMPKELGRVGELIAYYNPFTHFIEIIRFPLMYQKIPLESWAIVLTITILGSILAQYTYYKTRLSIVHWL